MLLLVLLTCFLGFWTAVEDGLPFLFNRVMLTCQKGMNELTCTDIEREDLDANDVPRDVSVRSMDSFPGGWTMSWWCNGSSQGQMSPPPLFLFSHPFLLVLLTLHSLTPTLTPSHTLTLTHSLSLTHTPTLTHTLPLTHSHSL